MGKTTTTIVPARSVDPDRVLWVRPSSWPPALARFESPEAVTAYIKSCPPFPRVQVEEGTWTGQRFFSKTALVKCSICGIPLPSSEAHAISPYFHPLVPSCPQYYYYHEGCWAHEEHPRTVPPPALPPAWAAWRDSRRRTPSHPTDPPSSAAHFELERPELDEVGNLAPGE